MERDVKELQLFLASKGDSKTRRFTGTVDGTVGTKTTDALMEYQLARGLTVDGKMGENVSF